MLINTMDKFNVILFIMIGLFSAVYPESCPEQCKCDKLEWNGENQNITNEILSDIANNGDPLTAKTLNLAGNNITYFPSREFISFTRLEELNLTQNHLTKVPKDLLNNIPSLLSIILHLNDLQELQKGDFIGYDNIEELDLFKSNIDKIEPNTFQNLPKLTKLLAESNNINVLEKGTLNGLNNVIWITFKNNGLEIIEAGVFEATPKLERLWLEKNKLTSLPRDIFKSSKGLYMVNFKDNQFTDCLLYTSPSPRDS